MARALAIDDDPDLLTLVERILEADGHAVSVARSGREGLEQVAQFRPDLVVCDVNMPGMDGFAVLEAIRGAHATADLPFVLLTALDDRESMRRGMRLGADDFLFKPVRRAELTESVTRALDKRRRLSSQLASTAITDPGQLQSRYASSLADGGARAAVSQRLSGNAGRLATRSVLAAAIHDFAVISGRMQSAEITDVLEKYLGVACERIIAHDGRILRLMGDGIVALFDGEAHAARAIQAGVDLLDAMAALNSRLAARIAFGRLPSMQLGVGVHTGPVSLPGATERDAGEDGLAAAGEGVDVALALQARSARIGWPMVVSIAAVEHAGPGFAVTQMQELEVTGHGGPLRVGRVVVDADGGERILGTVPLSPSLRAVLADNARDGASASKAALDWTLHAIEDFDGEEMERGTPSIHGYRILDKIGEGGMSTVYLAEDERHGSTAVLKVLKGRRADDEGLWNRFFQECAILSAIEHEHVIRIFDQGFGDELAYIAMEHLSGGGLDAQIAKGLSTRQSLSLLSQAAGALQEIHRRGIVHRDIKPANFLLRAEGVLVLTDFGVAKRLGNTATHTVHGEILGTPYYLSPEQAQGGEVGPQADLYSLGVIFFEMLTGRRPFAGETLVEILSQHLMAPVPRLPGELAEMQPIVDGLLAKKPQQRLADTHALLAEIDRVWTVQAMRAAH